MQKKEDIPKQPKQFYLHVEGKCTKVYQQSDDKGKQFWNKRWVRRERYGKAERISNMGKKLKGLEGGPKTKIHDSYRAALKKVLNWKTLGHDGIHGYWFIYITSIHDRLAIEMNRCLQGADIPE